MDINWGFFSRLSAVVLKRGPFPSNTVQAIKLDKSIETYVSEKKILSSFVWANKEKHEK